MQSTPSEADRTESRTDPGTDSIGDTVLPVRAPDASPTVVLRARVQWRAPVVVLPVLALVFIVFRQWSGVVLLLFALPFVPALWIRIELSERTVRRRDWRRRWTPVDVESVDVLRLRRLPFAALAWLPRGYRVGRFWSVPLTLRLQHDEAVRLEVRCVWWDDWRDLARYVAVRPNIDLDARTRGRLGRYVGPIAFVPSDQP